MLHSATISKKKSEAYIIEHTYRTCHRQLLPDALAAYNELLLKCTMIYKLSNQFRLTYDYKLVGMMSYEKLVDILYQFSLPRRTDRLHVTPEEISN